MFEELGWHAGGMGLRNVVIVGPVKSQLSIYFLKVHHTMYSQRQIIRLLKTSAFLDEFEDFMHHRV